MQPFRPPVNLRVESLTRKATPGATRARAILLLCGISLVWGSSWIISPLLANFATPFAAAALTSCLSALAVAAGLLTLRTSERAKSRRERRTISRATLFLGVTMLACPAALLLLAERHGISGFVPLLYACLPLLTALWKGRWSPAMIVAAGATLVLLNGTVPFHARQVLWTIPAIAAVCLQAFSLQYASRHLRGASLQALFASLGIQSAIAGTLLGAASLLHEPAPRLLPFAQWSAPAIVALCLLAILGSAIAYLGLYWLLARTPLQPSQAAATQWLQMLVLFCESAAFAHAWPTWLSVASASVLAGCFWAVLAEPVHEEQRAIALRDTPFE